MGMKAILLRGAAVVLLACISSGCGDNLQVAGPGASAIPPPQNLQALSLSDSSVRLQWTAPSGDVDSLLSGYVIRWQGKEDSVSRATFSFMATPVAQLQTLFQLYSRSLGGELSDPLSIHWAAAARYDSALVLTEYFLQEPNRTAGLHVGTQSTPPEAVVVDPVPSALVDVVLYGGIGQVSAPLALWSASLFSSAGNLTMFSTVTDGSPTLDFPLSLFPDISTFTRDSVAVADNTIYYVRVTGAGQNVYYARVHVHLRPAAFFPNRSVEIRVSLQRTPNLPYAYRYDDDGGVCDRACVQKSSSYDILCAVFRGGVPI
jgi:hypothetical protein